MIASLYIFTDSQLIHSVPLCAGLVPVVIHTKRDDAGQLVTDIGTFREQIRRLGPENIVSILSTTSCFAPRAPDNVCELAAMAAQWNVPHVVNNAYGLQSAYNVHQIETASRTGGRIDFFVQSSDKNFMVPVGGAIVATTNSAATLAQLAQMYPGRASSGPALDILITLLSMGEQGYKRLLAERLSNFAYLKRRLKAVAVAHETGGMHVIESKCNRISMALAMPDLGNEQIVQLGAKLFTRNIMGARAVPTNQKTVVGGIEFQSWGNHTNDVRVPPYLAVAAALGMRREEVDRFIDKLEKVLREIEASAATGQVAGGGAEE